MLFLVILHTEIKNKRLFTMNKMFRPLKGRVLAGVCAGVADFFGLDVKIIRTVWFLAALLGAGVLLYLILWLVIPEN